MSRIRHFVALALLLVASAVSSVARAETAWLTQDVSAVRWPDAPTTSIRLEKGARVEVVFRLEKKVRVMSGTNYGWVPADAITTTEPEGEKKDGLKLNGLPTLNLDDLPENGMPVPLPPM